jgi:hypothetical protein
MIRPKPGPGSVHRTLVLLSRRRARASPYLIRQSEISSIVQTPDGYLWLVTEFGLLRFNVVRPWPAPLPSSRSLLSSLAGLPPEIELRHGEFPTVAPRRPSSLFLPFLQRLERSGCAPSQRRGVDHFGVRPNSASLPNSRPFGLHPSLVSRHFCLRTRSRPRHPPVCSPVLGPERGVSRQDAGFGANHRRVSLAGHGLRSFSI